MPTRPITAAMIGAGERGNVYGTQASKAPERLRFVAVAEPNPTRRARFAAAHAIPPEGQFTTWEELLAGEQLADAAFVCTQDGEHTGPTLSSLERGYDVLLEKPMATTPADCVALVRAAKRTGRLLQVCHVLRYSPFFSTLHQIVASGRLGEIVTVEHRENVAYWHMAHSYVRGNWRSSSGSSPMILAKCCHDLDILYWNLGRCTQLSSTGALVHYRAENAPPSAPERCTDGCPAAATCPWYAPRLYLDLVPLMRMARHSTRWVERLGSRLALQFPALAHRLRWSLPSTGRAFDYRDWPISVVFGDAEPCDGYEARWQVLAEGPYSRCVYHCDNDAVDHQVVTMTLESGASAVLTMHGHAHEEARTMRYDGTRATLRGRFGYGTSSVMEIHEHGTGRVERIIPGAGSGGHGGGDEGIVVDFVRAVRGLPPLRAATTARDSLESHLLAFAAEEARVKGSVVAMEPFRNSFHPGG